MDDAAIRAGACSGARSAWWSGRWPLTAAGLLGLTALLALALGWHAGYERLMVLWIAYPSAFPFVDLHGLFSAGGCFARGIDVYAVNPCDALLRPFNLSPVWLWLVRWEAGPGTNAVIGLALAAALLCWLSLLPPSRSRADFLLRLAVLFSPGAVFGLERGNPDLIMFLMIGTAALWAGGRLRGLAYGLIEAAAVLKFYPAILLAGPVLWEPARIRGRYVGAMIAGLVLFVFLAHADLVQALGNVAQGIYFNNFFGASILPKGVQALLAPESRWPLWRLVYAGLLGAAGFRAHRVAAESALAEELRQLPSVATRLLVAGGLVILGCFFAGESIIYRGIYLLLLLPACGSGRLRRLAWLGAALLWLPNLPYLLAGSGLPGGALAAIAVWCLRELAWWRFVADLGGVLARLSLILLSSPRGEEGPVWA